MEDVEDEEEEKVEPVMDIDSANLKDPLSVVEYINEIYAHYRKTEVKFSLTLGNVFIFVCVFWNGSPRPSFYCL